jgi:hypothetical protein
MKIFSISVAVLSALMLLSTLLCGMWIRTHKITEVSSLDFHMKLGSATVIFALATAVLLIIQMVKR